MKRKRERERERDPIPSPPGPETSLHGAVGVSGARWLGAGSLPPPSAIDALAGLTSKRVKAFVLAQGEGTAWQGSAASQESGAGAAKGSAAGEEVRVGLPCSSDESLDALASPILFRPWAPLPASLTTAVHGNWLCPTF